MKNKALKIALASAIGAGIGTILALHHAWFFGLVAGAVSGYLLYDLKGAGSAISRAWRYVDGDQVKHVFSLIVMLLVMMGFAMLAHRGIEWSLSEIGFSVSSEAALLLASLWVIVALVVAFSFFSARANAEDAVKYNVPPPHEDADIAIFLKIGRLVEWARKGRLNAAVLILASPAISALWLPTVLLFHLLRFLARFSWRAIVLIHSDARLLVGLASLVGSLVGLAAGSAPIGMLAGALCGFLDYRYFSAKLLKFGH